MDILSKLPQSADFSSYDQLRSTQALNQAKSLENQNTKDQKDLEKATAGFEALLLHNMLQAMWKNVDSTKLLGENSNQAEIFRDMLHQAISDSVSTGKGIGVKDFMKDALHKRKPGQGI